MPALEAGQAAQAAQGVRGVKVDKVRSVGRQNGPRTTLLGSLGFGL